jgi:4-coumarate--CoA ligase (photoactive yellow protein activation family)
MRSFDITSEQMVKLVAALVADELARNFHRYTDFLTQTDWGASTRIGEEGLKLTEEQAAACVSRFCSFFDKPVEVLADIEAETLQDWADALSESVHQSLTTFRFYPATQGGGAETRHAADEVWQDVRMIASLMHGRRRVVSLVAPHSLFGFATTVLAPNLQGLPVLDGRGLAPDVLVEELDFGDLLVATPTLWRYLAQTLPAKFANNIVGVSFGEPLLIDLASDLREKGLGAMRELYGSTETGILAWRDTPVEPFVLFDHWEHDNDALIRKRPDRQKKTVMAMDHLEFVGERTFHLKGRRDGAVQIGAVNVFPKKISQIIAAHEDIQSCTVNVKKRDGALDQLVAEVVLEKAIVADETMAWKLDEWCRKKLRPQERPRIYVLS